MSVTIGSLPGYARWNIWAGDTSAIVITCRDVDGARVDLTSKTVRLRLRYSVEGTTTTVELLSGVASEVVVANQANPDTRGAVTITLTAARTAAFPRNASSFSWEVAILTGAVVETSIAGPVIIAGGVA